MRNWWVAGVLHQHGLATLLFDLLSDDEPAERNDRFEVELMTPRVMQALDWVATRADLAGRFRTEMDESIPCLTNPLGVKGVGELGTIGATPCVVNAVVDALWRAGKGERALSLQMPLTPERVWAVLNG